jgi:pimeloyl-ACP methyl ester carboxylesterase
MNLANRTLALAAALGLCLSAAASAAGPYQVIGTAESRTGNLVRTEATVRAGAHPLDRFKMIRLVQDDPASPLRGSILFLPPLGSSFAFYEQRDGSGGVGTSIAEFFALRGFDVYGYSPRFEGIPPGTCEAGLFDCSVMATWNLDSMVEDVAFIRSEIDRLHPGTRAVTGGASLGGILAVAAANAHPGDWDGIFPWEGMLATPNPEVQALNQGYCAALEAALAAGAAYDGVGVNVFREVTKLSRLTPRGLTPIPLFPPFLTNHQVLVLLLSVPSPGPVTMPVPGYIQMNGSLAEDRLFFADERRVYENVSRFNGYSPNVIARDVSCALAGTDTTHVSNLGAFTGSILAIGGGRGFGAYMDDQLAQFTGTADKVLLLEPEFGHIDHMMTRDHREYVERPIFEWAARVLGGS